MEDKFRKIIKKTGKKYDIPLWLIIVGFAVAVPLGVILLLLSFAEGDSASEDKRSDSPGGTRTERRADGFEGMTETERLSRMTELRRRERESAEKAKKMGSRKNKRIKSNGKRRRSAAEVLSVIFAVSHLIFGLLSLFATVGDDWALSIGSVMSLLRPFVISGIGFGLSGFFKRRSERYALYSILIGENEKCELSALASAADTSQKKVRRDLQNMISDGDFGPEAYIDVKRQMFFRSPKDGAEYEKLEAIRQLGDEKQAEDRVERDEYREIILEIRRLNDEIEDIAVSERIYRIEEISQNIFDYVKDNPSSRPTIRTFMNYYLPTTMKLLKSYAKIEKAGVAGDNMKKSKESIEGTLDMLVFAFEKQFDSLYAAESLDIDSDIDVLEAMMNRDGISKGWSDELTGSCGAAGEEKNNSI